MYKYGYFLPYLLIFVINLTSLYAAMHHSNTLLANHRYQPLDVHVLTFESLLSLEECY